jgi:8-oxo-dGTP pyrophosphatase MutT (NUDIX family)
VVARYAAVGFLFHAATRQVLLHHRDANTSFYPETWAGFGGSNEPEDDGDPPVTWRREMREELGIALTFDQIKPLRSYVNPHVGRLRYIFYVVWPSLDDDFALTEGDGYAWFPLDEAIALPDLMELARDDLVCLRDTVAQDAATSDGVGLDPVDPDGEASNDLRQELYLIADELRGSATLWKQFAANVYEAERADQAMRLAARIASLVDESSLAEVSAIFGADGWLRVSPAVGVDALVFNERGEILLLRRRDNSHWCMPGGIAEIGQTPAAAALRELWEEAGLRGEVQRLLGVFDGPRWGSRSKVHMMHLVYLVQCTDLKAVPGIEMLEACFFSPDALPEPMQPGHKLRLPVCLEMARTDQTYTDPATTYGLDLPMHQRPGH